MTWVKLLILVVLVSACSNDDSIRSISNVSKQEFLKVGCMEPSALNYDPEAQEAGSNCQFAGCMNSIYKTYDQKLEQAVLAYIEKYELNINDVLNEACSGLDGCMNQHAENFNPKADNDPGSCIFKGCTDGDNYADVTENAKIIDEYRKKFPEAELISTCTELKGCTVVEADNYDEKNKSEDGSCIFTGCTDGELYDDVTDNAEAIEKYLKDYPDAKVNLTCTALKGCTVAEAENYDEKYKSEDGSCIFTGCTDGELYDDVTDNAEAIEKYLKDYPDAKVNLTCTALKGCTVAESDNYDEKNKSEDGSCIFTGCIDSELYNDVTDNAEAIKKYLKDYPNAKVNYTCVELKGCKDLFADNRNPMATFDDGTCVFTVCDDNAFIEFNESKYNAAIAYINNYSKGKLINTNQCQTPKITKVQNTLDIIKDTSITSEDSEVHLVIDDSESMSEIINNTLLALKNISDTLLQTKTKLHFYRLSNLITRYSSYAAKIYDNSDGYANQWTYEYKLSNPFRVIDIDENTTESYIQGQLDIALANFQLTPTFTDENTLCPLSIFLHEKSKDMLSKNIVFWKITNEEAQELESGKLSANLCYLKYRQIDHYNYIDRDARFSFKRAGFTVNLYSYDANGERTDRPHWVYAEKNTPLSMDVYNSITTSYTACGQDVIDYTVQVKNLSVPNNVQCEYKRKTFSYSPGFSNLTLKNLANTAANACALSNFVINGVLYTDLYDYFGMDPYYYVDCDYHPATVSSAYNYQEILVDSSIESEYNVNSLLVSPHEILAQNGITGDLKNNFYSLLYFYNQANQNTCTPQQLPLMEHGAAYVLLMDHYELNGYPYSEGNICESSYNQNVKDSIGKALVDVAELEYALSEWSNKTIVASLKVKLENDAGQFLELTNTQFEVIDKNGVATLIFAQEIQDLLLEYKFIHYEFDNSNE